MRVKPVKQSPAAGVSKGRTARRMRTVGQTIPEIEEIPSVAKVQIDQGGFRVSKRVETREQLVDEVLRFERITIERRPVGRVVSDVPEARYEGDTWIIPVLEEVVVTEKRLMLVEEVRVTRSRGTHRKPQKVALRKEHVSVERVVAKDPSSDKSS